MRDVPIESLHSNGQVFAIKPNAAGNLVIIGDTTEIDTGYSYTTLFGASENGQLIALNENVEFFDYEDFEPIDTTIRSLQNHATLPQFGLFTTQYTDETILDLDVTLEAPAFILTSPSGDRWSIKVDDLGVLIIVKIV